MSDRIPYFFFGLAGNLDRLDGECGVYFESRMARVRRRCSIGSEYKPESEVEIGKGQEGGEGG